MLSENLAISREEGLRYSAPKTIWYSFNNNEDGETLEIHKIGQ